MTDYIQYRDADLNLHHILEDAPDPKRFRMHSHAKCELYCFIQGKGRYLIEGAEYPLEPGDILVMRPAEAHCIQLEPKHPYERLSIHFAPTLFEWMDPERKLLNIFFDREVGVLNRFTASDFPNSYYYETLMRAVTPNSLQRLQVLTFLPPLLNELHQAAQRRQQIDWVQEDSQMSQIIRYINNHLNERLTLDTLCSRFFISKPQLCRDFKQSIGAPIGEYILVKRLSVARRLLSEGLAPTQVFTRCGYGDYSAFYRAYLKHFGCPPSHENIHYP